MSPCTTSNVLLLLKVSARRPETVNTFRYMLLGETVFVLAFLDVRLLILELGT